MANDGFPAYRDTGSGPARQLFAVTPHATNELATIPKGIMVNVAGDIALRAVDSAADVTITVLAGTIYAVRAQYVRVTGTTATGITAWA